MQEITMIIVLILGVSDKYTNSKRQYIEGKIWGGDEDNLRLVFGLADKRQCRV